MELSHKQNIVEKLPGFIEKSGSQNKAATLLNVSAATLTQMKQGNWTNIADRMWNQIAEGIGYNPKNISWQIIGTDNFEAIQKRCKEAHELCKFRAISGYTGAGKTTAVKHYASETANAFYMLCKRSMNTKEFIKAIAFCLGIATEGTVYGLLQNIKSHIVRTGNILLILDDAGKLNDNCTLLIQDLYDDIEFKAGLIITGTDEELKDYILKMAAKGKRGFRQLKRRIEDWQPLRKPSVKVVKHIAAIYGIMDEHAVAFIANTCQEYGSIRNLISNASRVSVDAITLQDLQDTSKRLQITNY